MSNPISTKECQSATRSHEPGHHLKFPPSTRDKKILKYKINLGPQAEDTSISLYTKGHKCPNGALEHPSLRLILTIPTCVTGAVLQHWTWTYQISHIPIANKRLKVEEIITVFWQFWKKLNKQSTPIPALVVWAQHATFWPLPHTFVWLPAPVTTPLPIHC